MEQRERAMQRGGNAGLLGADGGMATTLNGNGRNGEEEVQGVERQLFLFLLRSCFQIPISS